MSALMPFADLWRMAQQGRADELQHALAEIGTASAEIGTASAEIGTASANDDACLAKLANVASRNDHVEVLRVLARFGLPALWEEEAGIRTARAQLESAALGCSDRVIQYVTAGHGSWHVAAMCAASWGNASTLILLLQHASATDVARCVLRAACCGQAHALQTLAAARIDLDVCVDGSSALCVATLNQHLDAVATLLAAKVRTDMPDLLKNRSAHYYASGQNGPPALVQQLTVSKLLARKPAFVRLLLAAKADVHSRRKKGNGLLHRVSPGCARQLLRARADIEAVNSKGKSALDTAFSSGSVKTAMVLLQAKARADVHRIVNYHHRADHQVVTPDRQDMLMMVARAKADLNTTNRLGESLVGEAARMNTGNVMACLLFAKCDCNMADARGSSPLHYAARNGTDSTNVHLLLAAKADVEACDANSQRPLHLAVKHGMYASVWALLQAKADVDGGNRDHASGNRDHASGNRDHASGNRDHASGNRDHVGTPYCLAKTNSKSAFMQLLADFNADVGRR
jgi:ankyrin repeat protein